VPGRVRPLPHRLLHVGDGLFQLALLGQGEAEVGEGAGVSGSEAEGLPVAGDGLLLVALPDQAQPQAVVGLGGIGPQPEGVAVGGRGLG
jgi:hypothetical protein